MKPLMLSLLFGCCAPPEERPAPPPPEDPPLSLARGLPPHSVCLARMAEAVRWKDLIIAARGSTLAFLPGAWFTAEEGYQIWWAAEWATDTDRISAERRDSLRQLIELVGWRRVLTGELPPPMPLEYYAETLYPQR